MHADLESIVCKLGDDPAICPREEAICAKVYRRTDRRRTPHDCISSWNELKSKQRKTQQNKTTLVAFYDTRPGNKVGLFYNAPKSTRSDKLQFL